jgi:RIO kinase 3
MSDEMLAQMLQLQFDQEYDRNLGKEEAKYNGSSKGLYRVQ